MKCNVSLAVYILHFDEIFKCFLLTIFTLGIRWKLIYNSCKVVVLVIKKEVLFYLIFII